MTLLKADYNRYRFFGADRRFHTIYACPLTKLIALQDWLDLLSQAITEANEEELFSFEDLYLSDDYIQHLCAQILEVSGIKEDWVDFNHLIAFVHHYEEDGELKPGIIAQVNGLNRKAGGEGGTSIEAYRAIACSSLIGLGLAKDFTEAEKILNETPLDYLEAVMSARSESMKTPKERKKEELKKQAEAVFKQQSEAIKQKGVAGLFDGFVPEGFGKNLKPPT